MLVTRLFDKIDMFIDHIDRGQALTIQYDNHDKDETTVREIMPIKLSDGHNILAFDGLKKSYRKFSIEKIDWVSDERVLH